MTDLSVNETIAKAFADQFDPPLRYIRTERINNVKMRDAFQVTYWSQDKSIGITAAVFEGQIHAFLEAAGRGDIAAEAGKAMARALGLFQETNGAIDGQGQ